MPPLILASASPRRHHLLQDAGLSFQVIPSTAEELHDPSIPPPDLTEQNARLKAEAVAKNHPDSLVIGADTLVCIDNDIIGKPSDFSDAVRMLNQLNGRTHQVCTGVCLHRVRPPKTISFHAITKVTFRKLTPDQILAYLEKINPLDKAGAYAAQDHGSLIIEKTKGSWTNVVGLPMELLLEKLQQFNESSLPPTSPPSH